MILLDTNIVSEMMRSHPDPAVDSWAAQQAVETLFFSAVGEAELRYGAEIMPDGRRREKLLSDIECCIPCSMIAYCHSTAAQLGHMPELPRIGAGPVNRSRRPMGRLQL